MRRAVVVYGATIVAVAVTLLARWLLDPVLGGQLPLVTVYGAVAAGVWLGGVGPALLAAVLGFAAGNFLFLTPRHSDPLDSVQDWVGLLAFLATCAVIVALGEALRGARRNAENRRRLFQVTLTSIGDAVIAADAEGRVTLLNPVAEALTGWTNAGAVGQPLTSVFHLVHGPSRAGLGDIVSRVIASDCTTIFGDDPLLIALGGEERALEGSAAPIRDGRGAAVGAVLVFRDISRRRHEEEALVESERRFRRMADSAPVMIWISGHDNLYTWFNQPWLDFTGRTLEQEIGDGWVRSVHADDLERCMRTHIDAAGARRAFFREHRLRRRDGEFRWVLDHGVPLHAPEGEFTGYIGSCIDITERKEAEERLRRAEEAARTVVENVADGIITIDGAGVIQSFNAAAERMLGYESGEVIGRKVTMLMPEPYRGADNGTIARYLETGVAQIIRSGREVEGVRRDGSIFPIDLAVSEYRLDGRRYFTGIVRDITERRMLERRLRERADQLAKEERRKDEFLATLAHELRNPLAPIHNAVQVLMTLGSPDPELRWCRDVIDRHVRHMARLLDDLLDVSRISHGKLELRKERIPLAAVVQSAVETSRPLIEGRHHELVVEVPAEPIYLEADPVRLAQVFSNLLNNAARYTEAGGHIRLSAEREGAEVAVRVKDDGIGISAGMMPHIFEIFSQAPEGMERSQGGLGVGLSLVRRLVQLHGGRIATKSAGRNQGSEFTVHLPVVVKPLAPAARREAVEPIARRRLLIVDDVKDAADSLAHLMRLKGHEVRAAYDGGAAIAAAAEFRPEVVLLDIGMPNLDGYETCRTIREQSWGKGMFLVALTGWGQEGDRRRAEEAGFNQHLVKPVDPAAFAALLAALPVSQAAQT